MKYEEIFINYDKKIKKQLNNICYSVIQILLSCFLGG